MAYFSFEDKKIFYRIIGKGIPLILLHGNTVSSKMFNQIIKQYSKYFQLILLDFPGHGKSTRVDRFELDFWYYNSKVAYALIETLKLDRVSILGTSGGALVAINLGLEHPEKLNYIIADSFEGEYPLKSYIDSLENERELDKKKWMAKLIWFYCHGFDWKKVVDLDTEVNIEFFKTGKSFFHRSISDLKVPTLITGSLQDEYCDHLDKIYGDLKMKNQGLEIHLFPNGNHPALLSNKKEFLELLKQRLLYQN